ncbi:MAG: hypothetical protein M1833_002976 [Piccolia ochrophora]|nr:MAG: hypothetical protein M1833_002976 [Piccolia ochrophora]
MPWTELNWIGLVDTKTRQAPAVEMPRKTRAAAAAEAERAEPAEPAEPVESAEPEEPARPEEEQEEPEPEPEPEPPQSDHALRGLQFDEPLSWRAGKPIAVAELLRRLQALSKELREMEQEENDRTSFTKVAKELAAQGLLGHKDRGVRAWTACCLVDILRLCAPDAPYTSNQLKDIFTLLVTSILPALSDPSNAYNNQHMYVLQSLAQVKSVILLTDLPSADSLTLHLFSSFFDILSGSSTASTGEQVGKHAEYQMTAILVILVDESATLPAEVVDVIVAQFLRADPNALASGGSKAKRNGTVPAADEKQSTLLLKELPAAYNMAKTICNSCPEKMARQVSQYFNDVILEASSSSAADGAGKNHAHRRATNDKDALDDDEGPSGPTEEDLREMHKAHRLLRELWRASPSVLQNVIPQLEAELATENVQLRLLATETLGDIVSGIGAAGPPPPPTMDPSAYPPPTMTDSSNSLTSANILTTPSSPQPFFQSHPAAYNSFLSRRNDKSAIIRSAWTTGIGKILSTSAGGVGLSQSDEQVLINDLAAKLCDPDERVRLAAIKAVGHFSLRDVIVKLCSVGGVDKEGSVLGNLAARCRDRKHAVRIEGMKVLAKIWGVAAGEIASGNEEVSSMLASIPSKVFDTFYVNDMDINVLLDQVLFEYLLPLSYPPLKTKAAKAGLSSSQSKVNGNQTNGDSAKETADPDRVRTERILLLVRDLDVRSKKAFFAMQARQNPLSQYMHAFLKRCEEYNGGVMDDNEASIKSNLTRLIDWFSKSLPDPLRVSADLWKFAKLHDRRSYQLVRFCMDPNSDYRTVHKAIKEFLRRVESAPGSPVGILETLTPLLYRVSLLVYSKSHVPAIVELSGSNENSFGAAAHEVLEEISNRTPEVFKGHVKELCGLLEAQAPSDKQPNEAGAVDTLKACAGYAQRFPSEMPQDRKFLQSLVNFALFGTPPAAGKHAVTIIMAAAEKKEMYAKDLVQKCTKGFKYGSKNFLVQLATLSQLMLKAPAEVSDDNDDVVDIAIKEILLKVRAPVDTDEDSWASDDELDDECKAKLWALRILVNRLRSHSDTSTLREVAQPVFQLLNTLISKMGELSKKKDTPPNHRSRLRLLAGQLLLKLCTTRTFDDLLAPRDFHRLALLAQDSLFPVRSGFVNKLKKYLGQNKLSQRFYTIIFLLAFEPQTDFRENTVTWIRSRAKQFAHQKATVLESVFSRLLSLLAHHPDFSDSTEDLTDFSRYILFYLQPVATEDNLSLIYYVAQRVKQTKDLLAPTDSDSLYLLSELAQAVIRRYEDVHGWSMQTWPGKLRLPASLFGALPSHDAAQAIATKKFLPDEVVEQLDDIVKRRSDAQPSDASGLKRRRTSATPTSASTKHSKLPYRRNTAKSAAKSTKAKKTIRSGSPDVPSSERRRSGRVAVGKPTTYAESSDEEDEAMGGVDEGEEGAAEEDEEEDVSD